MSRSLFKNRRSKPDAEWDKCNICGQRFPNWPELREHKHKHTQEEIDRSLKFKRDPSHQPKS